MTYAPSEDSETVLGVYQSKTGIRYSLAGWALVKLFNCDIDGKWSLMLPLDLQTELYEKKNGSAVQSLRCLHEETLGI